MVKNIEKIAKAIEADAGQNLEGIRGALTDLNNADLSGVTYKPEQLIIVAGRKASGLSQARFAEFINTPVRTLQEWEQGRAAPPGAAIKLCELIKENPKMVA